MEGQYALLTGRCIALTIPLLVACLSLTALSYSSKQSVFSYNYWQSNLPGDVIRLLPQASYLEGDAFKVKGLPLGLAKSCLSKSMEDGRI